MKKILTFILVISLSLSSSVSFAVEPPLPELPKGPMLLTSVQPHQLSPDFWINRLPHPNKLIKTEEEVDAFNQEVVEMFPDRVNIFDLPLTRVAKYIKDQIEKEYKAVSNRKLFDEQDKVVPKSFFQKNVQPILGLDRMPKKIKMKWAVAVRSTSVRALPTHKRMFEDVGDIEFDQLQFTRIKFWTPVGIFHTTNDGQWHYIQAPYSRGWVRSKDLATFNSRDELASYANRGDDYLLVTEPHVNIYGDSLLSQGYLTISMGSKLPILKTTQNYYEIYVPVRKKDGVVSLQRGFIDRRDDLTEGRMPYTQANVIRQAFKLLGARYGWGGTYKGRDCSGFIFDTFMSMGIEIPRNSKQQGFVGTQLSHFEPFEKDEEKIQILNSATEGITLLRMPLHIMIYLGQIDGLHYVIHSTWAERVSMDDDTKNRVNQVVVTDLTLNGNSYLGSLFHRTISINEVN